MTFWLTVYNMARGWVSRWANVNSLARPGSLPPKKNTRQFFVFCNVTTSFDWWAGSWHKMLQTCIWLCILFMKLLFMQVINLTHVFPDFLQNAGASWRSTLIMGEKLATGAKLTHQWVPKSWHSSTTLQTMNGLNSRLLHARQNLGFTQN